jgi:O-acetyl-ADP-ribose deacetylase (regulator of RNase III)
MTTHKTTLAVVRGSMMRQHVDAVVNAANAGLKDGGGIAGIIFAAAGQGLPDEIKQKYPGGTPTGTAVITGGHGLKQPYIIHTPGPVWHGGRSGEAELLASSYRSCLEVADANGLKSIAFCSISTGIFNYPLDKAAPLAVKTVQDYLDKHPDTSLERIVFAMFGEDEFKAFAKAYAEATA